MGWNKPDCFLACFIHCQKMEHFISANAFGLIILFFKRELLITAKQIQTLVWAIPHILWLNLEPTAWKTSSSFSSLPLDFVTISSWLYSAFRKWVKTENGNTLIQTKSTAHDGEIFHICFYWCGHNIHMDILTTLASWKNASKHLKTCTQQPCEYL